jgi:threonine aldolase
MPDRPVDLRSDTVTRPTPEMRRVIAEAEVGDDVFGDDPTVRALEEETARILGKEAAVYVPSGTMANEVAVAAHTERGDEVLLEERSHIFLYEGAGPALLSGVQVWPLRGHRGLIAPRTVEAAIRPVDPHFPVSRLLCLENTHNRAGGRVLPLGPLRELTELARNHGLRCHLDGARLWNAVAASGASADQYAALFDSVSVCFSKGLGAPVGSAVAGTGEWIARARHYRKRFGGGMRQAGILAAGALYALEHHRDRLSEDHARARRLAEGVDGIPGLGCVPEEVETNIILVTAESGVPAGRWVEGLAQRGVLASAVGPSTLRFVTHLQIGDADIGHALEAIRAVSLSVGSFR